VDTETTIEKGVSAEDLQPWLELLFWKTEGAGLWLEVERLVAHTLNRLEGAKEHYTGREVS
jgi:hypothetical protein